MVLQSLSCIFLLFLIIIFSNGQRSTKLNYHKQWKFKSCDTSNVDECAQVLFVYGYPLLEKITAKTEQEMGPYCSELRDAQKCVSDWGKTCVKQRIVRQVFNLFISGAVKSRKTLCSKSGQKKHFDNLKCVLDVMDDQHKCMHQFITEIDAANRARNAKLWIAQSCCFTLKWQKCFKDTADRHCSPEGIQYLQWVMEPFVESLDLVCNPQWTLNSHSCVEAFGSLKSFNSTKSLPKSLFVPMYQLFTSFIDNGQIKDIPAFTFTPA